MRIYANQSANLCKGSKTQKISCGFVPIRVDSRFQSARSLFVSVQCNEKRHCTIHSTHPHDDRITNVVGKSVSGSAFPF